MSIHEHIYYNSFNLIPQIGPVRFKMLQSYFKSLEKAWGANYSEFLEAGFESELIKKIIEKRKEISPEKEFEKVEKEGIRIITIMDENYPSALKEIASAPALLYIKGCLKKNEICIAIVGSRKISPYGKQVASQLSRELSLRGITIVSGMAYGTDSIAHDECIKLKKRTVAVLGGGIDDKSIYPASSREFAKKVYSEGALVSEYPVGTPPLKQHFPARNRIVSGLSVGTLVIEAAESSGALITAKFALEQNREVFAVPGNIYSKNSEGTNNLIKLGAKLVAKAGDIVEELNLEQLKDKAHCREIIPDNKEEAIILKNLSSDIPIHIDQLAKNIEMNNSAVSSLLTLMEIKGKVKNVGAMRYVIES